LQAEVLLITPPFTQLNTPYPATAYLKGFLNTINISSAQADLGIEVTLKIFSSAGLTTLFANFNDKTTDDENLLRIYRMRQQYINSIDAVVAFLQGRQPTLSRLIAARGFLPEAARFASLEDLQWAFGAMGLQDKAKYFATMYLEDLSDFIKATTDSFFGFSRYAERLARCAGSYDELYQSLQQPYTFTDQLLLPLLEERLTAIQPLLVALSVPFPGNLYAALRCGQYIKARHPHIKVALGGGFANTELRSLRDARLFEVLDFVTLDDGEAPIACLIDHIKNKTATDTLKRTFVATNQQVQFINNPSCADYKQGQVGTPDYEGLPLHQYISAIELVNPMHSLWSDGRWNKLTMAHGCYWGKCTFCDVSLPYIADYEPLTAAVICNRMEELIAQTGNNGFHFVDEAAPPALMRQVALEILRRGMVVSWWTNIRFEKSFTRDLCVLLKASGCIGVSGGLEVASDRLLELIQKGITVAQVARVNKNFLDAGILVHAYLMYGFPTQTAQETIDSLEMVRQMFEAGVLQSAFWHQFAMTAHSPVGLEPAAYQVYRTSQPGSFANNDVQHADPTGANHDSFGFGLKKSLLNFMHGACLDFPLHKWFDFKVPKTSVPANYIAAAIADAAWLPAKPGSRIVFIGNLPQINFLQKSKKGMQWEIGELSFDATIEKVAIKINRSEAEWLLEWLPKLSVKQVQLTTRQQLKESFENSGLGDFELFWDNKPMNNLHRAGLLQV
jgi:hypothetical protein